MKHFKFYLEHQYKKVTLEVSTDPEAGWPEIMDSFIDFLNGCGYVIDNDEVFDNLPVAKMDKATDFYSVD